MDNVNNCIEILQLVWHNTSLSVKASAANNRAEAGEKLIIAEAWQAEFDKLYNSMPVEEQVRVCEWWAHCS